MRFITTQAELNRAIGIASRAVNSRQIMPALKSLLLEVKGSMLTVYGTDLNISIKADLEVSGNEDGRALVDARLLGEIVRALPNSLVSVSAERGNLNINALSSEFNLATLNDDEFPAFSDIPNGAEFSIKTDSFMRLVKGTTFAASVDEKKGVLVGCLLEASSDHAKMVALDGFRLAFTQEEVSVSGAHSAIVPAKDLESVSAILKGKNSAEVKIQLTDSLAKFTVDSVTVISRLLSGKFVSYEQIIPKSYNTRVRIDKNDLVSALERASLLSKEGKNNLVKFDISEHKLIITSRGDEGKVKETIETDTEGANLVIGFNAKYILDALKAIPQDEVCLEMTTAVAAMLIKPVEGDTFTYLVLPVRLKEVE